MNHNCIKNLDLISPKITMYFQGHKRFSTLIGGISTISLIIIGIVIFLKELINYLNNDFKNIQYYRKYLKDIGKYKFNTTKDSIILYLNFLDNTNKYKDIDFSKVRLIGTQVNDFTGHKDIYYNQDHWLFGNCSSLLNNKEFEYILKEIDFKTALCIQYYYNKEKREYYLYNDINFKTPIIKNSSSSFNILILKCSNNSVSDSIYGKCSDENDIINYIDKEIDKIELSYSFHDINLIDSKTTDDIIINSMLSQIEIKNTFHTERINFSPLIIEKYTGGIFEKSEIINTYTFHDNKESSKLNFPSLDILTSFTFMFDNTSHYYIYSFKTPFEFINRVTIVIEVVYYSFYGFNFIYNFFIRIISFHHLIFRIGKYDSLNQINLFYENYKFNTNTYYKNNNINISKNIMLNDEDNISKKYKNINTKSNKLINIEQSLRRNFTKSNNLLSKKKIKVNNIGQFEDKDLSRNIVFTIKDIVSYICYLTINKCNKSSFSLFDSIYKKLMSVENLYRIHLLLYLIKNQHKMTNLLENYKAFYE